MHMPPSVYIASVEVTQLGRGLFTQAMRLCYMLHMPMPAYILAVSMLHHAACECDALLLRMKGTQLNAQLTLCPSCNVAVTDRLSSCPRTVTLDMSWHLKRKSRVLMVRRSCWSSWLASCRLKVVWRAALSMHIWATGCDPMSGA